MKNKLAAEVKFLLEAYNNSSVDEDDFLDRIRSLNQINSVSDEAMKIIENIVKSTDNDDDIQCGGCGMPSRPRKILNKHTTRPSGGSCFSSSGSC